MIAMIGSVVDGCVDLSVCVLWMLDDGMWSTGKLCRTRCLMCFGITDVLLAIAYHVSSHGNFRTKLIIETF